MCTSSCPVNSAHSILILHKIVSSSREVHLSAHNSAFVSTPLALTTRRCACLIPNARVDVVSRAQWTAPVPISHLITLGVRGSWNEIFSPPISQSPVIIATSIHHETVDTFASVFGSEILSRRQYLGTPQTTWSVSHDCLLDTVHFRIDKWNIRRFISICKTYLALKRRQLSACW